MISSPAASCAKIESTRVSHHRSAKRSGIPCAMVLRLPSCSPRRPGFVVSVGDNARALHRISASGYQAHTTSPSATTRLVERAIGVVTRQREPLRAGGNRTRDRISGDENLAVRLELHATCLIRVAEEIRCRQATRAENVDGRFALPLATPSTAAPAFAGTAGAGMVAVAIYQSPDMISGD